MTDAPRSDAESSAESPTAERSDATAERSDAEVAAQRLGHLAPAIVLALAVVGFFTGTHQLKADAPASRDDAPAASVGKVPSAVEYAQLPKVNLGPNATWEARLGEEAEARSGLEPVPVPVAAEREEALRKRATRRAYMGAPPVIPHQVDARSAESCLACHEKGLRRGDVFAPAMPHDPFVNCLQCHAAPTPAALSGVPPSGFASGFVGLPERRVGERAGPGAPPVIPHPTAMRERCTTCHVQTTSGLKTTHPWRVNCVQCHASSTGFAR